MMGQKAGFDMTTQEGLEEFSLHYNANIAPQLVAEANEAHYCSSTQKPLKLKLEPHLTDMTKPAGEKVPKQMQLKFNEITALTDDFCDQHLNTEYADMSRQLTAALCRIDPSPRRYAESA